VKRILKILLLIPILYIVVMPFWFRHTSGSVACGELNIIISDSNEYRFVSEHQIRDRLYGGPDRFAGIPAAEIKLDAIENRIAAINELRRTEAYITIDGTLHIEVAQRKPLLRVQSSSGSEYYIDEEGYILKKRGLYPPRVHIAGGRIDIKEGYIAGSRVGDPGMPTVLGDLFDLVVFLKKSQLWSAMIDQIEVAPGGDIILIPRAGSHRIVLGDPGNLQLKMNALEAFYRQVLPVTGWDAYSVINLKYEDQLIAKRRK
jgi:cell division protein FtsQ